MTSPQDPTNPLIVQGVSIGGTALASFLAAYFLANRNTARGKKLKDELRLADLERQLALLNQSIQPISVAFQSILVKQLTHYHTPDIDALLQKLGPPYTLTEAEEKQLTTALIERTSDVGNEIDDSERVAASLLPFVMARVKIEKEAISKQHSLMLVAVPIEVDK